LLVDNYYFTGLFLLVTYTFPPTIAGLFLNCLSEPPNPQGLP